MSVHFTLSDVDPEIPVKKEALGDVRFKPFSTHFLSKKRKVEELYDLDTPASNLMMAADVLIDRYSEKVQAVDDLMEAQKKSNLKLEKAKRKIQVLKTMLAHKSSHANEEGSEANSTLLEEAKRDATMAVLESKIHMATEAAENGLDASLWDVKGWKDKLAQMKDDYAPGQYFIGFGGSKVPKRSAAKAPSIKIFDIPNRGEASASKFLEDVTPSDNPINSEGSSGEDGI